jgi:membrane associated rhomboid family serine protease
LAAQLDIITRFKVWYAAQPRALRLLLTINVVAYLLWHIVLAHIAVVNEFVWGTLALHSVWPDVALTPWQLVTYNFLHLDPGLGGLIHIAFNMLWLVWLGRDYEFMHGSERLMAIYLLTGIAGGLLTVLFDLVTTATFVVHGASASVLGVVATVAFLYPTRRIGLFLLGNIRLIYLLAAFLVLDLLFMAGSNTAVAAHFGGAAGGFLFAQAEKRGIDAWSWTRFFFRDHRRHKAPRTRYKASASQTGSAIGRLEAWLASRNRREPARITKLEVARHPEDVESADQSELDRILDKISDKGLEALTPEERRFLQKTSQE